MSDVEISAARRLYWSVRRELWENRAIYLAPLIVAALVLVGFGLSLFTLPARMRAASTLDPPDLRAAIEQPYVIAAIVLMAVDLLVAVFYCVDALYGERRDRSILFWKSLPVSDLTTVLAKASIPVLVLPLVTLVATVVTQGIMLLASSAVLAANGMSAATLSAQRPFLEMSRINLGHILMLHGIWYAPFYAWLLLVSAWATRLPFLWATLPPVVIGIVERIAFNSTHFATLVATHLVGGPSLSPGESDTASGMTMEMLAPHQLRDFLVRPGLWGGLAVTAVFLLAAVRLRRQRGAI
jgi:ABC-2 type transport system permease protein